MIKDIGEISYFKIKKSDLIGLKKSDCVHFKIKSIDFTIKVSTLLEKFKNSKDWQENGVHKQPKSIPKWIFKVNEYKNDFLPSSSISEVRAASIWDLLVEKAERKSTITYGELAQKIGCHHRPLRYSLGFIQDEIIKQDLPALNILVVNKKGKPGSGFVARPANEFKESLDEVYKHSWNKVLNPFENLKGIKELPKIIENYKLEPNNIKEITSKIKSRGMAQTFFRSLILELYNGKCSFCNLGFEELLQASHIIPWSKCEDMELKIDPRNGILLCANHHRLFDCGYLAIDSNYRLQYCDGDPGDDYSDSDISLTVSLNDRKINLPNDSRFYPSKYSLKYHRENIFSEE